MKKGVYLRRPVSHASPLPRPAMLKRKVVVVKTKVPPTRLVRQVSSFSSRWRRQSVQEKLDLAAVECTDTGYESDDSIVAVPKVGDKRLQLARHRCGKYWDQGAFGSGSKPSILETKSVSAATSAQYRTYYKEFLMFCRSEDRDIKHGIGLDQALVQLFTTLFFEGWEANRGEKTLAAVMMHLPRFGNQGDLKLPRARKALAGWRKLAPQRARTPHTVFVVSGLSALLASRGELAMAIFVVLAFLTYARPGSLMCV